MKQKIKHFLILTIFLLSLSFLASCQKVQKEQDTQYSDSQPAGKQKIICYDVTVSAPYMEDLVKVFNAQSSTTEVEMRYLEDSEYEDRLNKLLEEGGQADVIWLRQPSKSNRMAEAGQLFDLSQLVGGSALDISKYGQSLDIVKLDESIYSLPFIQNIWLLFYNRDIFDGLHMDYPGQMTWKEYADLAARIDGTASDGQKRWGGYLPIWVPNLGALELGEYLYDDELPATKEFLQLMDRLYNQDHSHPNPVEMEEIYTPGYEAFLDGGIGMMINGDWTIQILQNLEASGTVSCRWDAAPLPLSEGVEPGTSVGSNSYLAVYSGSSYPENAFEFLEFACGEEGASILASHYCFPSYFTEEGRESYKQNAGAIHVNFFFDAILQNEEGKHVLYQDLRDIFDKEAVSYLKGEKTLDQTMKDYLKERNNLNRN